MTGPDLWVVVPAHNEAARIGATLSALAAQSDLDFTLLVVDNASTDGTPGVVREFSAAAPFPVRLIAEPDKGVGCAVDTGFRYAISQGASILARTDADCLPRPGWVAAARAALTGPSSRGRAARDSRQAADMVCGRIRARRDEHGALGRMGLPLLVVLASTFGRLRPANRGARFKTPYRMHAGNNMAITAELYLTVGGMPRRPSPTDRAFLNLVRRHTSDIRRSRAMVVENSTRRLRAYGLVGTARWYLDKGSAGRTEDPR